MGSIETRILKCYLTCRPGGKCCRPPHGWSFHRYVYSFAFRENTAADKDLEHVIWRLCFYINLPLGVVTAVIVLFLVPNSYDPERHIRRRLPLKEKLQEMDLYGLVVLVPTIICILLATQWGGTKYSWSNARIIALFVVGSVLFAAFVVIEIRQGDRAIVPPSLIKRRTVWACSIFSFCLFGSFLVVAYFLPLWFQAIKGDTATESGIHNLPSILGTTIFSVAAGGMVFGLGYYTWACILGSVLAAVVCVMHKNI